MRSSSQHPNLSMGLRLTRRGGSMRMYPHWHQWLSLLPPSLNSRIRSRGRSAHEMWYRRDKFTNSQIPFTDMQLILDQHRLRTSNHPHSEKAKSPGGKTPPPRQRCWERRFTSMPTVECTWCNVHKFVGNQLRSTSYRVKRSMCYRSSPLLLRHRSLHSSSRRAMTTLRVMTRVQAPVPYVPPDIHAVLSTPTEP